MGDLALHVFRSAADRNSSFDPPPLRLISRWGSQRGRGIHDSRCPSGSADWTEMDGYGGHTPSATGLVLVVRSPQARSRSWGFSMCCCGLGTRTQNYMPQLGYVGGHPLRLLKFTQGSGEAGKSCGCPSCLLPQGCFPGAWQTQVARNRQRGPLSRDPKRTAIRPRTCGHDQHDDTSPANFQVHRRIALSVGWGPTQLGSRRTRYSVSCAQSRRPNQKKSLPCSNDKLAHLPQIKLSPKRHHGPLAPILTNGAFAVFHASSALLRISPPRPMGSPSPATAAPCHPETEHWVMGRWGRAG